MKITQSTIERLAWWVVFLVLLLSAATFAKLTYDDNKKFQVLRRNQDTLICIVRGFNNPANAHTDFIDNCVRTTQ